MPRRRPVSRLPGRAQRVSQSCGCPARFCGLREGPDVRLLRRQTQPLASPRTGVPGSGFRVPGSGFGMPAGGKELVNPRPKHIRIEAGALRPGCRPSRGRGAPGRCAVRREAALGRLRLICHPLDVQQMLRRDVVGCDVAAPSAASQGSSRDPTRLSCPPTHGS